MQDKNRYKEYPEKILQFGAGVFLRAFADWMLDEMNDRGLFNGSITIVQPRNNRTICDMLNRQNCNYTLLMRGMEKSEVIETHKVIHSVKRCINTYDQYDEYMNCATNPNLRFVISNTTEAGIVYDGTTKHTDTPPSSFPAKVTVLLYRRYQAFGGSKDKGLVFLPCELIENNGDLLKEIILRHARDWDLGDGFIQWVEQDNVFTNTLVDRIATGYPKEEAPALFGKMGYEDPLLDTAEPYHLWVIEGDAKLAEEIPFEKAGLHVIWTEDITPYRERKVRILNGAHTMTVLAAYLAGKDTVGECMDDPSIAQFMRKGILEEVAVTLNFSPEEIKEFAESVFERFRNPFIKHYLLSIALNSVSKWKTRILPSLLDYQRITGKLPDKLSFSLAALVAFYRGKRKETVEYVGEREGRSYTIADAPSAIALFADLWANYETTGDLRALVNEVLGAEQLWGQTLHKIEGLDEKVFSYLSSIIEEGAYATMSSLD